MAVSSAALPGVGARPAEHRDHGFHQLTVREVKRETADACSIVFDVPEEFADRYHYRAGQFLTFRLRIDGTTHLRSYSMSSSPDLGDALQVTVKRVEGGVVSNWISDRLTPGQTVESTLPAGVFCLGDGTGELVALAGGSGITPVFSLVKTALATTDRSIRLLYANRDQASVIFDGALAELSRQHPGRLSVVHHLDADDGFVSAEEVRRMSAGDQADYYVCGPAAFMDLVEQTLVAGGVATPRIHIERFTPFTEPVSPPPPAEDPGADDIATVEVTIELDGRTETTAHHPGATILQTARQAGMSPPFSCESGNCATCMARLMTGSVTMRENNALTDDEVDEGWILTCQSLPTQGPVHVIYEPDGI